MATKSLTYKEIMLCLEVDNDVFEMEDNGIDVLSDSDAHKLMEESK